MKIYERQYYGEKYVETGECRPPHVSEMYLSPGYGPNKAHSDFPTQASYPILRLATPEEIAGTEKKMCPAGCGADYGAHASHQGCPWFKALLKKGDFDSTADFPLCSAYADAHWRDFVKYEVGVDLGKEPSESAGVHLTPESVGKAYRNGFGKKVVLRWDNDGSAFEYCAVEIDGRLTFHAYRNNGMSCLGDRRHDLISEWDEKAEAGSSLGEVSKPSDDRSEVREAAPAQPEILPTWTDGDVRAELAARTGVVHVDAAENRRRLVAVMAEDAKPREVYQPDAPDRRAEHVPVAKAWVNPAMLGR